MGEAAGEAVGADVTGLRPSAMTLCLSFPRVLLPPPPCSPLSTPCTRGQPARRASRRADTSHEVAREAKAADTWIWGGSILSQRAGIVGPGEHDALKRKRHGVDANPLVIKRSQNMHCPDTAPCSALIVLVDGACGCTYYREEEVGVAVAPENDVLS